MLINCDLGECLTPSPDKTLMPLIDMANIACGGHAGNDKSMVQAIQLAVQNGVKIGAHPSYADTQNFGRVSQTLNDETLFDLVYQQVKHFQMLCSDNGAKLDYIKPHGALYHDMAAKISVFQTLCRVIEKIDANLNLIVPMDFKAMTGTRLQREMFADRTYENGKIVPRSWANSVLTQADIIIAQYQKLLSTKGVESICFHGDNPASVEALKMIRK